MKRGMGSRQQREDSQVTRAVAGMRGGLGRILLTAFMLLAIVPLSIVSFLAIRRVREDVRRSAEESLAHVAASVSGQLQSWLATQGYGLSLLASEPGLVRAAREAQWSTACEVVRAVDC